MTRLSDTQAVILSAASQRDDGAILPLPEKLKIKGGAADKVLGSLKAKGLIDHLGTPAPLRGLMRCAHCSSAMTPTHTRRRGRLYRYYVCLGASRRGHGTCPVRSIAAR